MAPIVRRLPPKTDMDATMMATANSVRAATFASERGDET